MGRRCFCGILILALAASLAGTVAAAPRVAYVKGNALWRAPIQSDGRLARGARATKLLDLGKVRADEWLKLSASLDGRWLALARWEENAGEASSTVLIDLAATGRDRVRKLAGSEPAFSPDGKRVAYDGMADGKRGVVILTLATGEQRLLRAGVESPSWEDDRIAVCGSESEASFEGSLLVLDAKTGRQAYSIGPAVNPMPPTLSPNGRYLAFEFHLSRPVVGDTLVDITVPPGPHGEIVSLNPPLQRGRAARRDGWAGHRLRPPEGGEFHGSGPEEIAAWSRDSRQVLWVYLLPDRENNGIWDREDLWLAAVGSAHARRVARGRWSARYTEADFTPDQKHVLWFQHREGDGPGDIRCTPLAGGKSVTVVRGVRAFAVVP